MSTWCALLCLLAAAGCQTVPPFRSKAVRRSQPLLGTFVVVTAYGGDEAETSRAVTAAFEEIRRIDALMSLHRTDSELAIVNARAREQPMAVSSELFAVISKALEIAEQTGGRFDPTVAPLTQLWGFLWKEHRLPSREELAGVLPRVNYRLVRLDAERRTVRFQTNGVALDLNGIAKGYAVDCAIEKLRELGVTNAMVRAGGDLRVTGAPPGEEAWSVQIEDPTLKGERRQMRLRDAALSTSGSYQNFFVVGGRRYSHLLNPVTGMPAEEVVSCSVKAATCMESDAWATALAVMGREEALRHFGERMAMLFAEAGPEGGVEWVRSKPFPGFK